MYCVFFHIALYSIILFCVFLWIPFVYFYYEEKDDDNMNKCSVRMIFFSSTLVVLYANSVPDTHYRYVYSKFNGGD